MLDQILSITSCVDSSEPGYTGDVYVYGLSISGNLYVLTPIYKERKPGDYNPAEVIGQEWKPVCGSPEKKVA